MFLFLLPCLFIWRPKQRFWTNALFIFYTHCSVSHMVCDTSVFRSYECNIFCLPEPPLFCGHATQKKRSSLYGRSSLTVMMLFPIHSPCTHTLTICAILHHNPKVLRCYKPEWLLIKATCRNSAYRLLIVFVFLRTCTFCLTVL